MACGARGDALRIGPSLHRDNKKNAPAAELSDYISTPIKKASHTAVLGRAVSVLLIEQSLNRACNMFVRVVAPETKFAVGPLAQAGEWGPWHARDTGS